MYNLNDMKFREIKTIISVPAVAYSVLVVVQVAESYLNEGYLHMPKTMVWQRVHSIVLSVDV